MSYSYLFTTSTVLRLHTFLSCLPSFSHLIRTLRFSLPLRGFRYLSHQTSLFRGRLCVISWLLLCCSGPQWAWSRETMCLLLWHPEGQTECSRSALERISVPRRYHVLVEKVLVTMLVTTLIAWLVFASSMTFT
jgi:hypothetical protein